MKFKAFIKHVRLDSALSQNLRVDAFLGVLAFESARPGLRADEEGGLAALLACSHGRMAVT